MDLISIANELHNWIKMSKKFKSSEDKNDDIIIKKIEIISENLDAIINEHKLYENPTEKNN